MQNKRCFILPPWWSWAGLCRPHSLEYCRTPAQPNISARLPLPSWAGWKCSLRGFPASLQHFWEGEDWALLTARHDWVLSSEEQCAREILFGILSWQPHRHPHCCFQPLLPTGSKSVKMILYLCFNRGACQGQDFHGEESGSSAPHSSSDAPNSDTWVFTHFHKAGVSQQAHHHELPLSRICSLHLGKCSNSSVI